VVIFDFLLLSLISFSHWVLVDVKFLHHLDLVVVGYLLSSLFHVVLFYFFDIEFCSWFLSCSRQFPSCLCNYWFFSGLLPSLVSLWPLLVILVSVLTFLVVGFPLVIAFVFLVCCVCHCCGH